MIYYLENLILENWSKWVNTAKPEKLDFLKIHAGQAIRNKKVGFFIFNGKKPILFIKTIREAKYNSIIENGFRKLQSVNDNSAPKPIYIGKHEGITFSIEDAILGKQFHSCKKKKHIDIFLKWFFNFQKLMFSKKKSIKLSDYINKLVSKFSDLYKLDIKGAEYSLEIDIPLFAQHGDLTPDNVLMDNKEIKVIDWDNFNKIDLPLFDLLVFLQRWSGIRDISFIYEYSEIIRKYLEKFKIDKRVLKSLVFSYYLLDFIRKKDSLTDYDKEYLRARLKEIKKSNLNI